MADEWRSFPSAMPRQHQRVLVWTGGEVREMTFDGSTLPPVFYFANTEWELEADGQLWRDLPNEP